MKLEYKEIQTKRLELKKISINDAGLFLKLFGDENITKYISAKKLNNIEDSINFLKKTINNIEEKNSLAWTIYLKETNCAIGYIGLFYISHLHHYASFGSILLNEYHNKGYITEAHKAIITYAFTFTELNRLESQFYEKKTNVGRMLEKSGMKKEALIRENFLIDNEYKNSIMFSIVKSDFIKNKNFYKV